MDELRAVVADDDLHTLGQPGSDLMELLLHRLDDLERVLLVAHDHDPLYDLALAVELGDTAPDVGPEDDLAQILDPDGRAELATADDDLFKVLDGLGVAVATDHVLGAAELHEPAPDLGGAVAHCLHDLLNPDAVAAQPIRVDVDLVLLLVAAHRRHLGDPGHRLEVVPEVPVLIGPEIGQAVVTRFVDQGVLVDPAKADGVGPEFGTDAIGELLQHRRQVLQRPRSRPVEIGPVLEDDVNERVAEVRNAAHRPHPRRAEHGADDGVGDLVLDDVR